MARPMALSKLASTESQVCLISPDVRQLFPTLGAAGQMLSTSIALQSAHCPTLCSRGLQLMENAGMPVGECRDACWSMQGCTFTDSHEAK
jgi:hypothetical protein